MRNSFVFSVFQLFDRRKTSSLLLILLLHCGITGHWIYAENPTRPATSQSSNRQLEGVVKDKMGDPLVGASVAIKGTTRGVITDLDGNFSLQVAPNDVLVISYIGMQTQEVPVGNQRFLNIILSDNTQLIDEVVVIGYGTVKKSNVSGAVSTVSAKDLQKVPAANLSQALQGNVPGLHALQSDRNPGAKVSLKIRGDNSFSGGDPLFIVDGFPIASDGSINAINPNDIESVTVLKDASSTSIYGARAANGVILITTKSGKIGKPTLEIDIFTGIKYANNPIKTMNAAQFADLRRESFEMDGNPVPDYAFLATERAMLDAGRSTNWWDEVTGSGRLTQSYQISYGSGTETTKVHVGAGFFDEKGIVNNTGFKRGNLRFNASQKFGDRLTVSTYNSISLVSNTGADQTNILFPSLIGNPMAPVKDENGDYYAMIQNALGTPRANPVAFSELPINRVMEPMINTSLALDLKLIEGLHLRTQATGDIDSWRQNFYNPRSISGQDERNGRRSDGYAFIRHTVAYNWISETTLSFNRTFNNIHNINAVGGFSVQSNHWETATAYASGFASDAYEMYSLGASYGAAIKPASELRKWNMLSYFGRVVYTLKDKYIFTGNMRVDGSSRFGENNKYGLFPSGAVAWRLSEEEFMQSQDWLSDLKIRGSYGLSGNANAIDPYTTLARLETSPYNFNGTEAPGYYENNLPSPDLKWETTQQLDLGLDVSVFNQRLSLTMDYYYKKTRDLIRQVNIPLISGFPNSYANLGDLQNQGIELGINSVNLDGEFSWRTSFIIASNKNKLTSLGDGSDRIGTDHWKGKPIGIGNRYMLKSNGIWQLEEEAEAKKYDAKPGDVKYVDVDENGVINDDDRVFVGNYYPNFYGSLTNEFGYKNFDLNIFMTFEQGRDVYNGMNYILLSGSTADNNRIEMLDRWTPTNPSNKYPRASNDANNRSTARSSEFLESASYLKVKNITLGYTFPTQWVAPAGMSFLRLYASVTNPFTFTKYTGIDPEDGDISNGERKNFYPVTTTYMLGLQVKF